MNLPTNEIDRVVREVLAELGAARGGEEHPTMTLGISSETQSDGELIVASRVVSTHELLGRLDSVRRVVVSKGAVVTPAARDELLRRGIGLAYADPADAGKPPVRLVMTVAASDFDAAPLADAMQREGFRAERSQSDCLIEAVDRLAQETSRPDTLGVLLTSHAAAGLCLANRLRGVRAVGAENAADAADIGANLLVADPRAGSFFQLKQMVAEFARGGVQPCPAVFRERLM